MKRAMGLLLTGLLVVGTAGALADDPEVKASEHGLLLERLKTGDTDIDYFVLRRSFVGTAEYNPFGSGDIESTKTMRQSFSKEKYQKAIKIAEGILENAYIDGDAHLIAGMSHEKLGNAEQAQYHLEIVRGLFESICSGTDGRAPESPCRVISTGEEYFYMRMAGLKLLRQALTDCAFGPCDSMEVRSTETDETFTLYFDVSTKMDFMDKLLGGK